MTASFWQALDRLGADGVAASDWRLHLGDDWDAVRSYLRKSHRLAETVIDRTRPPRRLLVEPDADEPDRFVGICDDTCDLHPPVPLTRDDVEVLQPDWDQLTTALAEEFSFAGNRWETAGHVRKIGTSQYGSSTVRAVILCLPPGHLMRQAVLMAEFSRLKDAIVLVPSTRLLSPELDSLAKAQGLQVIGLAEHFAKTAVGETESGYLTATHGGAAGRGKAITPVFRMQSGWTWEMLTIEVATGGRLIFRCDEQSKDVRLPKSNGGNHSEGYEILFRLAFDEEQEHELPASKADDNERVRRRFTRLKGQLKKLFDVPGDPFRKVRNRVYVPRFKLVPHRDLASQASEYSIS